MEGDVQELVSKFQHLALKDEDPQDPIEVSFPRLIRPDAGTIFKEHHHEIFHVWTTILLKTSLAPDAKCTDVAVKSAFEFLDGIITGDAHALVKRLAYLQLTTLLRVVQDIIAIDRQKRLIRPKYGKPNVSVSIDVYLSIHDKGFPRTAILRRVRRAKRWIDLAGPSPLLLLTFSREAEKIIGNTTVSNGQLRLIASEVLRIYPPSVIQASTYIYQQGQLAADGLWTV